MFQFLYILQKNVALTKFAHFPLIYYRTYIYDPEFNTATVGPPSQVLRYVVWLLLIVGVSYSGKVLVQAGLVNRCNSDTYSMMFSLTCIHFFFNVCHPKVFKHIYKYIMMYQSNTTKTLLCILLY